MQRTLPPFGLLCACVVAAACAAASVASERQPVAASVNELAPAAGPVFERDIRPILKAHCWHCHGEAEQREGGLDTRLARWIREGGDSGAAVEPGDHAASLLYQRVADGDMPPGEKPLSADELQRLAAWIDSGAKTARPEPATLTEETWFTEEERAHWAFQPIERPQVPQTGSTETRNPIDAFLLARLESERLGFAPPADRATLVRRVYFDLLGLPPEPEELSRILEDDSPAWYERLVDRLLASPAYGERWGRHWLDVAGYADSDGYTAKDLQRPWAWRYRDYVIRAFNADRPWSDLIVEQMAGDELLEPPYKNLTSEQADALIATGFLRMAPDGTGDGTANKDAAINDLLADTVKITSTALLGLTVGCAQCHDHRYDPISQKDYHRFRALFEPAYDWKNWRAPKARLVSLWSSETRQRAQEVEQAIKEVQERRDAALDKIVAETFEHELSKLPNEVQADARLARETAAGERSESQQQLVKQYPFLNVNRRTVYLYLEDRLRGFNKEWEARIEQVASQRPPDDFVRCLTEVPNRDVPRSLLFVRGDFTQPSEEVQPGPLSILARDEVSIPIDDPQRPTSGRRLAYARYLTDGRHPLVARVLMNRFWMHHFGRGIVATPGDFGVLGAPPSHPELLDFLASEFMQRQWRLKPMQRMMVLSRAYQQSSVHRSEHDAIDPENRLWGRMPVRRLEAELVRDAILTASGRLVHLPFGTPTPVAPDEVGQIVVGVDTRDSAGRPTGKTVDLGGKQFRRSIYVEVRRSMPLGVLEPFDSPVMSPNCEVRAASTVAPQSLLMMNSPFITEQAAAMATRVRDHAGEDPVAQVRFAWTLAFGREASDSQIAGAVRFLRGASEAVSSPAEPAAKDAAEPALPNLTTFCQALLCSTRFLYVE